MMPNLLSNSMEPSEKKIKSLGIYLSTFFLFQCIYILSKALAHDDSFHPF